MNLPRECPRWPGCSVNACPLDVRYSDLPVHPGDKEQKCGVSKAIRLRIAAKHPGHLANGGLTRREAAGKRGYEALPPSVKADMAQRGKGIIAKINAGKL